MSKRPYFSITKHSFEKNAGYKSTVHALAELIDNAFEAEASKVAIVLQIDSQSRLQRIAVVDDGKGMSGELLQMAVCEKAGSYLDRQSGDGPSSRRKLGKYGVGFPKSSISQCNNLSAWSWTSGGYKNAQKNGIDITDNDWIKAGAEVDDSVKEAAPERWLKAAELDDCESGTMVLWEDLDGLTWARARWGEFAGLIPNLEFEIGRVYRKLIDDPSADFIVYYTVIDSRFTPKEPTTPILSNDPLYLTEGQKIPKKELDDSTSWPPDDPLFDEGIMDELNLDVPFNGAIRNVTVKWRCSEARKNAFCKLNRANAGNLPHGRHARKNVGLSILREGREINMSMALAVPSEPRERWFGVEIDIPHELDVILGMTNNKQEYTRLERVLQHDPKQYLAEGETSQACLERIQDEDNDLAICLNIAWKTQSIWDKTKLNHLNMREEHFKSDPDTGDDDSTQDDDAESRAEVTASQADPPDKKPKTKEEASSLKSEFEKELETAGVPKNEAEQVAERIVDKGLSYAIAFRNGLGSPFFNVREIKGVKLIELNTDHLAYAYLKKSIDNDQTDDVNELKNRLETLKTILHLIFEAWAKNEVEALVKEEKRQFHRVREDWGRTLEMFIGQFEKENNGEG